MICMAEYFTELPYISHHGIRGQQWGKRNGPPYPLGGGDYSKEEMRALRRERKKSNSIYNKKHYDKIIKQGTEISTLSYDKDRTKDADMFYATYKQLDKHQYNALFNRPVKDENGTHLKYRIKNEAKNDIKVASEDSGANAFLDLYNKDRDFYNFVRDPDRMQNYFVDDKYKFKGYRDAKKKSRSNQRKRCAEGKRYS